MHAFRAQEQKSSSVSVPSLMELSCASARYTEDRRPHSCKVFSFLSFFLFKDEIKSQNYFFQASRHMPDDANGPCYHVCIRVQLLELHVLFVPADQWNVKLNKVPAEATESFISAGFIR